MGPCAGALVGNWSAALGPVSAHLLNRPVSLDLEDEAVDRFGLRPRDDLPRVSLQGQLDTLDSGSEISSICAPYVDHIAAQT